MRGDRKRKRIIAEMNIVPYVDVMLVLLVIFMITTPLLSQGVKVNLPKTQAQAIAPQDQEPIIVSVDEKGDFYLNLSDHPNEVISADDLVYRVTAQLQVDADRHEQRLILVRGDSRAEYAKVVAAMLLLQRAGANNIGLVTESPRSVLDAR